MTAPDAGRPAVSVEEMLADPILEALEALGIEDAEMSDARVIADNVAAALADAGIGPIAEARAAAMGEAADEVHREARFQYETAKRHGPGPHPVTFSDQQVAEHVSERMVIVERILRNHADRIETPCAGCLHSDCKDCHAVPPEIEAEFQPTPPEATS